MAVYFTVILLSATLAFTHAQMKIDSRCPKVNGDMATYLPHETSCAKYYVCDTGMAITLGCPNFLLWNAEKNICDFPDMVECKVVAEVAPEGYSVLAAPEGKKDSRCPNKNLALPVYLPHATDCTQFYICDSGYAFVKTCQFSLFFNTRVNACDHPYNVDCVNGKRP